MKSASAHDGGPLRVLELGHRPGTALCANLLGALGAVVRKVEVPDQRHRAVEAPFAAADGTPLDGTRAFLDGGKETVHLSAHDDPAAALAGWVAGSDVLVTCLSDEELAALDVAPAPLRGRHKGLVLARLEPFDDDGPGSPLGGELQAQAASGMMTMIGRPEREPLRLPGWQADYTAGCTLLTGIMMALLRRDADGRGTTVSTNAVRAMAFLDWKSQIFYEEEHSVLVRGSDRGPVVVACRDGFAGFYYRPEDWDDVRRLLDDPRLDDPRFATQQLRDEHRDDLTVVLEEFTSRLTRRELYERGQAGGIPVGPVWTLLELLDDPQYRARDFVRQVDARELGTLALPRAPFTIDGARPDEPGAGDLATTASTTRGDA